MREVGKHLGITIYQYLSNALFPLAGPVSLLALTLFALTRIISTDSYVRLSAVASACSLLYIVSFAFFCMKRKERALIVERLRTKSVTTVFWRWISLPTVSDKR
jgi:hypothetical protein